MLANLKKPRALSHNITYALLIYCLSVQSTFLNADPPSERINSAQNSSPPSQNTLQEGATPSPPKTHDENDQKEKKSTTSKAAGKAAGIVGFVSGIFAITSGVKDLTGSASAEAVPKQESTTES